MNKRITKTKTPVMPKTPPPEEMNRLPVEMMCDEVLVKQHVERRRKPARRKPVSQVKADGMHLHAAGAVRQKAIETVYRGYEFRSRLEAKWAAFFDLCGWKWSYEPPEFNGWIPDFALGEPATLVEIKPFFHEDEWHSSGTVQKVLDSGCTQDVLLLGADATWWQKECDYGAPQIGWEMQNVSGQGEHWVDLLLFGISVNGKLGLCCANLGYINRAWSLPKGKPSRVELCGGVRGGAQSRSKLGGSLQQVEMDAGVEQWLTTMDGSGCLTR